jgi:hypothetical protein
VSDADPSLLHGPCITNLARVHLATCILRLGCFAQLLPAACASVAFAKTPRRRAG